MQEVATGFDKLKKRSQFISTTIRNVSALIDKRPTPAQAATEDPPPTPPAITLDNGETITPGLDMATQARTLSDRAQGIDEGFFTIVVVGMFKNGKSTLLNAILGDRALPTGAAPSTGVITMLVYGTSDLVEIYEYGREEPRRLTRTEFFDEFSLRTEDADELKDFRFKNVRYAKIYTTHKICQQGVRLVDSPGLGEHTSRSELTTSFLKEAQAVILVLKADRLLGAEERNFIDDELGKGRLDHVFFVINGINQIEDQDEIPALEDRAFRILKQHFVVDGTDRVDEARYAQRVFWVNALAALKVRQGKMLDPKALRASNVPSFEEALETFLTSDDDMFRAQVASSLQVLVSTIKEALIYVRGQKKVITKPLDELRASRDQVSEDLNDLERHVADIEELIAVKSDTMCINLKSHLQTFVDQMRIDWENGTDLEPLLDQLEEIKFTDIALAGVPSIGQPRRKKVATIMKTVVEKYVNDKFELWSKQATKLTEADIAELQEKLQARINEYAIKLRQAQRTFVGDSDMINQEQNEIAISITTTIFAGGKGISGIIAGTLRRIFALLLLLSVTTLTLFGWILLALIVLYEVGLFRSRESNFKRELLNRLIPKIHASLKADLNTVELTTSNFADFPGFLTRLRQQSKLLDKYLWKHLSDETRAQVGTLSLDALEAASSSRGEALAELVIKDLNRIAKAEPLYTPDRFQDIQLTDETTRLLENPHLAKDTYLVNRFLLIEAYPDFLAAKLEDTINSNVRAEFMRLSRELTSDMYDRISALRNRMNQAIDDLERTDFNINAEQKRLDHISQLLLSMLNAIRQLANEPGYTLADLIGPDGEG